ncbi:Vms1/Ankzf1 family peptidyl-tRNA hydrolase [Streptomyces olivoreticuli]|uniref:Vms1/Ankzf1 family peptidyl-tRNA hydrolase n=1 Tax=Streptomyces blastmyceticus TaxID=68180 RepID=A0ABN0XBJ2_9ACTN|nr:Vms1/Ankzf1 family peptidyl-tRNA hydrolase [Streptomyces olivoreticuli]WKK23558.1 Vms1/Ankzf1 family peptidyl-tRNA hydrolase [Streptomyces olivoreticuli]
MTTATATDTGTLRDLLQAPGPFLSVYFDREARPQLAQAAQSRWRGLTGRLAEEGAAPATLDALTSEVMDRLPGTGVLAAFAAEGKVRHVVELPGGGHGDLAMSGPLPHLLPLMEWRQDHPAHVVVVVDRSGADLLLYAEGSTEPVRRTVTGPDDEIGRSSGLPQMRFQHRAEDSWEHNATAVADAVAEALGEVSARLLLVAGDVRARQYLTKHLPSRVLRDVSIGQVSGGRSEDGSGGGRAAQVAAEASAAAREETAELLRRLDEERAPGGHAVEGVHETLEALAAGRVGTLAVTDDPRDARTAWFGTSPTDVYERHEDFVPNGSGPLVSGRLADVAVRSALLTGADVRILEPDTPGAPSQGTGGICRFG